MQCQVAETDSKVQAKMLSLCMAELIDALMTMSCLATTAVVLKQTLMTEMAIEWAKAV